MSNKERRKFNKKVYQHGGHITPVKREAHKQEDGIPVHTLDRVRRRYWSAVNRYGRLRDELFKPLMQESA